MLHAMKLLLHTCCAPCLIYPLERLKEKGFSVEGFFYNPNIHPFAEYENRKRAIIDFVNKISKIDITYSEYFPEEYFRSINLKEKTGERCSLCWLLRLKETAKRAKENGFDAFSTTLLVSPYQNQELLKRIGEDVAKDCKIEFYYEDFRPGFRKARDLAKSHGIYCQRYCGCIYSEVERCRKSEKR